ncbi:hypothetical protein P3X46_002625 [Hevea brasiliensis]|uniref:WPP domain-containing protein n=1 Tax=Hevea brasiliensis TaxID=3981 RepID=A0ABQ9N715_HEVBR|nr:WPP domain-interacting protein 1 isoform X2 [Hevea brasiliensis]KAJ9187133.1 hypothetical protein P3X46_002625 [Hevea brasiliensis]
MDLEGENAALESVEDNELTTNLDSVSNLDQNKGKFEANGSCSNEIHNMSTSRIFDANTEHHDGLVKEGAGIEQLENENSVNSQPLTAKSPIMGSPTMTKGYGLRKWRRLKREVVKDANASADNSKVLKRGLSSSGTKLTNLLPAVIKQNSEGSTGSANVLRNAGVIDGLATRGPCLESSFAVGSAFVLGIDSENSEDRSSKSSTAASAPRLRYDLPAVLGYMRERNRINLSRKSVASSIQQVSLGKVRAESSKKPRGDKVKIEKENSHSSMESDSRSANFVFMQGVCSVTSNGNQSENYDGENSDDGHAGEQQFSEEVQTVYGQENVGEVKNASQDDLAADASWEDKEEKSENHQPTTDHDPLVESLIILQTVQEVLESEVRKFEEIGKISSVPLDSTSADRGIHESSSSDQFDSEKIRRSSSLESQVLSLTENIKYFETKLEEANTMLNVKESRIVELENTLISGKSPTEESGNTMELQHEKSREIETELEGLFKQKIEAEVEYLTLSMMVQKLRVAASDQLTLFEQQEALSGEQAQMLNKLGEAERKASMLKKQAEEVEKYCSDILGTEEVLKMQRRVCKVTSCFFIQLSLLMLVFWLLVLQMSPHSGAVVPT